MAMAKKLEAHSVPLALLESGSGLTAADESWLRECLGQLEPFIARYSYLGGKEATQLFTLQRKILERLNPAKPETLCEEARKFVADFGIFDWYKAAVAEMVG